MKNVQTIEKEITIIILTVSHVDNIFYFTFRMFKMYKLR